MLCCHSCALYEVQCKPQALLYSNKDLMEPVWIALTGHWHKCHAVPFEIEAKGLFAKQVLSGGHCCLHRSI